MFVLDLLPPALRPMIFPDPGVERIFIDPKVTRGLCNRLLRFDREFDGALLEYGGDIFSLWVGSSNTPRMLRTVLVSVCLVEYSHINKPIADMTPYPLPAGSRLLQDLGFLAFTLP